MSLVGPRPYLPREINDIGEYYPYITSVKPGITGLWQISGRSEVSFKKRMDYDVQYYNSYSLKEDMKILFLTTKKILKKEGAL